MRIYVNRFKWIVLPVVCVSLFLTIALLFRYKLLSDSYIKIKDADKKAVDLKLTKTQLEFEKLKQEDQYKKNEALQKEITAIEKTYASAVGSYELLLDIKPQIKKSDQYDKLFALSLSYLSKRNYSSASATLTDLSKQLQTEKDKLAVITSGTGAVVTAPASNTPPGSGYNRQSVHTDIGDFVVDIVAADMGSTRVIVDTAYDSDCRDGCAALPLGDYVSRNGAFAGVNGSYFCPPEYPTCAGKTNTFDTLLMNKNKHYFNSDNNVYSTVPAAIFGNGFMRFVGKSQEWGRDTGIDSMIANQPLVLSGGSVAFNGDGDPKKGSKGNRSFVGNKGSTAYIGVVRSATVAEVGYALKALGLENALNLDSGGSTALWSGGYKLGPGRNIPNAILFVRK